jgi:DNA-binding MarR family transcriptional regulator
MIALISVKVRRLWSEILDIADVHSYDLPMTVGDGDTPELVLSAIRQILRSIDLRSRQLEKKHDITVPQLVVLKEIGRSGECTVGETAKRVSLSQATVTSILDRLERKQYVIRQRSSSDRRRVMLSLTEAGTKKLQESPPLLQEDFLKRFAALEKWEQTSMLSVLERLASMLNADKLEVPPLLTVDSSILDERNTSSLTDDE